MPKQDPRNFPLPGLRKHFGVTEMRAAFEADRPLGIKLAEKAFISRKLALLQTHPMAAATRAFAATKFKETFAKELSFEEDQPIPGGVGYGMFFNAASKIDFVTGTAISWEIVCPTSPGGNVNDFLYVTATNRSALGVEAFVGYHAQDDPSFNIFDWARSDHWRPAVAFQNMGNYLGTDSANGIARQILPLINRTYQDSPGNWVNEVLLWNTATNTWDSVYQYPYQATLQQQTEGYVGSWGPIVETFQDLYAGTNPLGALKTQVVSRDAEGNWGQWNLLSSETCDLRVDQNGFRPEFLNANYAWTVVS